MADKFLQEFFNELYNDSLKTNNTDIELHKIKVPLPPPIPSFHVFPPLPPLSSPPILPPPPLSPSTINFKHTVQCPYFNKGICKFGK